MLQGKLNFLTLGRTTIVQGGGGVPRIFDMLQYFETILPSVESLWSSQHDEVYFMGSGDAMRPMTSPKMVAILAAILGFTKLKKSV